MMFLALPFLVERCRYRCSVVEKVLVILMEIHEAGFAHNDVKLANITINCEGRATLIDVGSVTRVKVGQ